MISFHFPFLFWLKEKTAKGMAVGDLKNHTQK